MKTFGFILALCGLALAQEDLSTWAHSQKILINTTSSGANIGAAVTGFPLLVRLNKTVWPGISGTLAGGADVRFSKADGSPLAYEIEHWVDGDSGLVWVKTDVAANDNSQFIKIWWGKPGAASASNGPAVFDTTNGFQAVWHFNEAAGEVAKDATVNKYDATPVGTTAKPGAAGGPIGNAKSFDGKGTGYQAMGTAAGKVNFIENGNYGVSAWAYLSAPPKGGTYYNVCNKSDVQYNLVCNDAGKWEFTQFSKVKRFDMTGNANPDKAAALVWVNLVGQRAGAKQYLWINGVCVDSTIKSKTESFGYATTYDAGVGKQTNGTDVFQGNIDEVRFESVVRGKDWIKLEFENQKAGSTVLTFDASSGLRNPYTIQPKVGGGNIVTDLLGRNLAPRRIMAQGLRIIVE